MQLTTSHPSAPSPPHLHAPSLARFVDLAFRDRAPRATATPPDHAAAPLFTHHQIVELAAPFARQGLSLDLAASDRLQRKLVFRCPRQEPAPGSSVDGGAPSETLELHSLRPGYFRLTRQLEDGGLQATLHAEGPGPGELLARVLAVPAQRLFQRGAGYRIVSSGCVPMADAADAGFELTHAVLMTDALTLEVRVSSTDSATVTSADVHVLPRHRGDVLPADLLAVLGWDWSLLQAGSPGWHGSVRLRGRPGSRGDDALHKLHLAAAHLSKTLAEPPACFHQRLRAARLGVLARHALPLLAFAVLALQALFADALRDARASPLTLGLMCIAPALMLLFMLRSERPRLALPTWPRPPSVQAWGIAP